MNLSQVVIWCRNWILYNKSLYNWGPRPLWFDVEIGYYTTTTIFATEVVQLWFDVEISLHIWTTNAVV